ncbi:MAG: DNA replication/repair protein RecF [bacterium]|nr:DNA replication/repair protein RecF [bacterium]
MFQNLRLQQFRSYSDEIFEFEPGVNIIVGPNGSGKTNLLEAILIIASGSSYRVGDEELIKFGKDWARLDGGLDVNQRTIKLVQENGRITKSYIFDDKPYKILTHAHTLPVVLFEPNHLQLLHGQPELRRNFIDALLEQMHPSFGITRKHYRRALLQRNTLLKALKRPSADQLFVWNLRLSELGGAIAKARTNLITELKTVLPELYSQVAGSSEVVVSIEYDSKLPPDTYESALIRILEKNLDKDIARGFTSYGPHRDDIVVTFNERPAVEVASRGETRTALLALKIFELGLLERLRGQKPVLLLDDVFSELDGKRRHALASFLQTHQTFITTTDADLVLDSHMPSSHILPVG